MIHEIKGTVKYKKRRFKYEAQIYTQSTLDPRVFVIQPVSDGPISERQQSILEPIVIEDAKERIMLARNNIPTTETIEEFTKKLAKGRDPRPGFEWYLTGTGQLVSVHSIERCDGKNCVIHCPSNHHMRTWPTHWRDDRHMMERICEHGVGHPDPGHRGDTIHGCDGCCVPPNLRQVEDDSEL